MIEIGKSVDLVLGVQTWWLDRCESVEPALSCQGY